MSLYTKKKDVDRYVKEILSKTKSDNERKLKGFTVARMYHHVGEQRTALQYLSWYLVVRPDAAAAHKLRGQILAADSQPGAALVAYERALELDPHQKDLVMTGCRLLLELPPDTGSGELWLQRANKYFPNDAIISKLKTRALDGKLDGKSAEELEELIAAEAAAEPGDVERHVRLCELLRRRGRSAEALAYARRAESRRPFPRSAVWYRCVADVCEEVGSDEAQDRAALHTLHLTALDRLVALGLEHRSPLSEVTTDLYRLDQRLFSAARELASLQGEQTRLEWRAFSNHITGQLYYHLASLVLYSAQQGGGESREAQDMALVLMLAAQGFPPLQTVSKMYQVSSRQEELDVWRRSAAARLAEVGWCILAADRHGTHNRALTVQQQLCNQQGRSRIYNRVFGSGAVSSLGQKSSSAFLTLPAFLETNPTRPRPDELSQLTETAAPESAGSLRRAAWLRAQGAPPPPVAPQLPLSTADTATAAPESLCRLDVLAFLEATVFTTLQLRAAGGRDTQPMHPPSVASSVCTEDQALWWSAVTSLYGEAVAPRELSALRRTLQRGLEAVRCLSGHGNSARLVLRLADWALQQAVSVPPQQTSAYEARAELYLRAARQQLDRLRSGVPPPPPPKQPLFQTMTSEPSVEEAVPLLDAASRRLSELLLHRGELQEALVLVQGLPSAEAAFQQGTVLRQMAAEAGGEREGELLRQAQEAFFLTLDRLRDPGCDAPPQLKDELATQLREVEEMLEEVLSNSGTQLNGNSSMQAALESSLAPASALALSRRSVMAATSTPRRPASAAATLATPRTAGRPNTTTATTATSPLNLSASFGQEARPSLERVCAEVVSLRGLLTERREHEEVVWRRCSDELRASLVRDVRDLITGELQQERLKIQQLEKEVAELRASRSSEQPAAAAPAAAPAPPMMSPEMYGYMAALANMRGVPIMPMGVPNPLQYPAAAYQGLSLQDTMQEPMAPQMPQPGLATPLSHPNLSAQLGTPTLPGQLGTPVLSAQLSTPSLPAGQLMQPKVPPPQPAAAAATPAFFKPPASTEVTSTPVKPAPANVTVSGREPLPPPVSAGTGTPAPSVVVPREHIKPPVVASPAAPSAAPATAVKSPHQFQIQLPAGAQVQVASPLADTDKPAFSSVSSLPNIPAPQYSAVSPLQGRAGAGPSPGRQRLDSTGSFHEDPEYEPMADFKPIVPLPEEVEVRTGEEGDCCLFSARCKLYRFSEGEWKERGVGELRVLHREEDGRVRLIMRRDQTHKVCANHYLQPGMKVTGMANQSKAFIWAAQDFADEELKDERLCARFKTEDIANEFKQAFERGVDLVTTGPTKVSSGEKPAAAWTPAAAKSAAASTSGPAATAPVSSIPASTPASASAIKGFTFSAPRLGGSAPAPARAVFGEAVVPTVVSARFGEGETGGDDDDEYETEEEETTSDESESDDEPVRIACKPEFNFGASAGADAAFSFGFGGGGAAAAEASGTAAKPSAAAAAGGGGFTFGDKPATTEATFSFGLGKAATTASSSGATIAAAKLSTTSAAATPAAGFSFGMPASTPSVTSTAPSVSLGGFSFTSTPTVLKAPEPAPPTSSAAPAADSKPNPFAGFSFGAAGGGAESPFASSQVFGDNSAVTFAKAAETGPGFKKDDSFSGFAGSGAPVFSVGAADRSRGEAADDTAASEEYEPSAHFEPVVPLPDLVVVKTGEEAEEKLFGVRAKLYRMAGTEWKERGIGEMKILHNKDSGKCRILMRREQVLKLCANHVITASMKLNSLSTSESAWVWSATDFADGEANKETLAVKFKTVDQAKEFKEMFEWCQSFSTSGTSAGTDKAPTTSATTTKPAKAASPKPASTSSAKPAAAPSTRGASKPKPSGAALAVTTPQKPAVSSPAVGTASFVFGAGGGGGGNSFSFSGVKPRSPVKPRSREVSLNESGADEDGYYEGDEGEHLLFEPVVPLPDKVEVVTGEEGEEVLYSHRSKLYRFDGPTGEWKERGLGDIKLLENRRTANIRLLMRREQVLKLCLNHRLTPALKMKAKDDKSVMWAAVDYADPAEPKDEVFTARFKTAEVAAQFLAAVESAQARLTASPSKPAAEAAESDPDAEAEAEADAEAAVSASFTLRLRPDAADDDVQIVSELQPTAEERAAAERLQLPAGFYLYRLRPACRGCRGCRDELPGEQAGSYDGGAAAPAASAAPAPASTIASTSSATATSSAASTIASTNTAASSSFSFSSFAFGGGQTTPAAQPPPLTTFSFGASSAASSPFSFAAVKNETASIFGGTPSKAETGSIFGGTPSKSQTDSVFGGGAAKADTGSLFGGTSVKADTGSLFGGTSAKADTGSLFGGTSVKTDTGSLFGGTSAKTDTGSLFGGTSAKTDTGSLFGGTSAMTETGSIFGGAAKTPTVADSPKSLFGGGGSGIKPATLFGASGSESTPGGSTFGGAASQPSSVFGATASPSGSIFGGSGTQDKVKSMFGGDSSSKPTDNQEKPGLFGKSDKEKPSSVFGSQSANGVSGSSSGSEQDKPTFGFGLQASGPAIDFSQIAKSGDTFAEKSDPSFQFSGAGTSLFGSHAAEGGSDEEAQQEAGHDPQFEPAVPLPALVEVRTGEESETSVFCQRAILYRFTKDTAEWKERGRGDFKLLHNAATGNYRVLLRREQVHKLACNHRVTPDMTLSRLGPSTNAWVWSAVDYADEEPKPETLAVKFKTEALADEYKTLFEAAVARVREGGSGPPQSEPRAAEETPPRAAEETPPRAAEETPPRPAEETSPQVEYEDDDEDEESAMFDKPATLLVQTGSGWKELGNGQLRVLYDGEMFAAKVLMLEEHTDDLLCENIITMQHTHKVEGRTVEWSAVDFVAAEEGMLLTFRARLASPEEAQQLAGVLEEGVEFAVASGVTDELTEGDGPADED